MPFCTVFPLPRALVFSLGGGTAKVVVPSCHMFPFEVGPLGGIAEYLDPTGANLDNNLDDEPVTFAAGRQLIITVTGVLLMFRNANYIFHGYRGKRVLWYG
jgi:hypothetical protein